MSIRNSVFSYTDATAAAGRRRRRRYLPSPPRPEGKGHQGPGHQFRNLIRPVPSPLSSSRVYTAWNRYGVTSGATLSICVPFAISPRPSSSALLLALNSFHGASGSQPPRAAHPERVSCRALSLFENTVLVNT